MELNRAGTGSWCVKISESGTLLNDTGCEMRVLLRQTKTKLYYVSLHQWAADADSAFDFGDVEGAIKLSREANLTEVEVVLAYDDPLCDLVLPVHGGL